MDNDHASTSENLLQILALNDDCEIFVAGYLNARTGGLNFILNFFLLFEKVKIIYEAKYINFTLGK